MHPSDVDEPKKEKEELEESIVARLCHTLQLLVSTRQITVLVFGRELQAALYLRSCDQLRTF